MSAKAPVHIVAADFGTVGNATPLVTVSLPSAAIGNTSHFLIVGGSAHITGGVSTHRWAELDPQKLADFWGLNPTTYAARTAIYLDRLHGGAQLAIDDARLLKAGDTINTAELVPLCNGESIDYIHLEVLAYN